MPTVSREEYFNLPLEVDESSGAVTKIYVLVIYDIVDNRRRTFLAKTLSGFGYRVQESAFEAILTKPQLAKLLTKIERFSQEDDNFESTKSEVTPQSPSTANDDSPTPTTLHSSEHTGATRRLRLPLPHRICHRPRRTISPARGRKP